MALRDVLIRWVTEVDQKPIDKAQASTEKLTKTLQGAVQAAQALAGAFGVQQLYQFISGTVAAADDIGDMAARLGIATDEFQVFKAVAEDAGTSVGGIQSAFRNLAKAAQDGGKDFAALGVSLTGAGGVQKDTTTLFWEAGEAIGAMSDQNDRLAAAQKLFGRSGLDLIPIFTAEKGSLDELKEAAVVYSEEFIESADKIAKRQMILDLRFQKTKALVVEKLLPAFEWLVTKAGKVAGAFAEWTKTGEGTNAVIAGAVTVVAALTAAMIPLAISALAAAAPFIGLFLILNDLITFMQGGDSVIGRFITTVLGAESIEPIRYALDMVTEGFKDFFKLITGKETPEQFKENFRGAIDGIKLAIDEVVKHAEDKLGPIAWLIRTTTATSDTATKDKGILQLTPGEAVSELPRRAWSMFDDFGGAGAGAAPMPMLPTPSLSPKEAATAAAMGYSSSVEVTNHISVGEATPSQTREVARQVGDATAAAGRDRAATGAAFGLGN
jgi:hypothetical protein